LDAPCRLVEESRPGRRGLNPEVSGYQLAVSGRSDWGTVRYAVGHAAVGGTVVLRAHLYSAGDATADLVSGGAGSDLCVVGPEDLPYTSGCEVLYVQ
jgi:hypothetical protein